ncbi:ABC-2 type transport system permease protein [Dysgonomonas sp. PFB1-18]|uniref:ABC transporter permease n=1 Tax=unclassified Dysgonomonas TaxID=2630389 RepID=UPI002473DD04|nr:MULTISPECIES: ABC transporter permease [unclassified Dysgonomonas]MDH6310821.1 ABC-2 type transport system permease protein [Dysgonomonas sp. PF1-14]MDH6340671.1 ABC-2 type transport system permease protein [Dysgonomonas sp. PF1-16]MDH6382222.1 ABC-2 type transport system permease protein [Dysgonomonas sp. PFB1-18]MDH6399641.1 ABC-2 type transport system permease protein [Dysgonomonas sp. PF1-23]
MKKLLLDIYYVWINELKVVFKDEAVILLFFIVPLAYPVLYSFIYNNETAREVKVVVVDDSHSALSREFKRKVDATADVHVIGYATDMEEAREAMRRKEAYGIMYIPADFSRKINTQQQTTVSVYADMSSLLFYKAMLLSATEVSLDMGADIRVAETGGETQEQDQTTRQTVESEWVTMYNPQNGFASFLVPAILLLIIQQTLILGIATIVGTHNDKKRFTIASHTAEGKNVGAIKLTIGKAFCYASLYMVVSVWVLRVIPYLFKFPQIGDPLTIAAFLMPFLLAATFFGMTLSYFCSQREFGMILFVFTSVIFIFISGISWPWTAIPDSIKAIAYIIPSTPGIHGFIKINTMGSTLVDVWPEYIALWVQSLIYCITAILMYRWWIQNYDPEYKGMLSKR